MLRKLFGTGVLALILSGAVAYGQAPPGEPKPAPLFADWEPPEATPVELTPQAKRLLAQGQRALWASVAIQAIC